MADPFAESIAESLAAHVGAITEQQRALEAQGTEHFEASCRLNRGLHELDIALKLLRAEARR